MAELPDGKRVRLDGDEDPRKVFANWLTTSDNPWFSRAIVNRVWYWLMGRGLTADPDEAGPNAAVENAALDEWQNVAEGCVRRALGELRVFRSCQFALEAVEEPVEYKPLPFV